MEMTSYPPGMPSWVDIGVPDMDAAVAFYGGLFGWTIDAGPDEAGGYRLATLDGRVVAGFGPQMNPGPPAWMTYLAVADLEETTEAIAAAGGTVMMSMDVMTQGRMAVCTDNAGVFFSVWQEVDFAGAEVVNEPGALVWNELTTRAVDEALAFYPTVFGWGHVTNDGPAGRYIEWQLGGRTMGGMMPMEGDMWPPQVPNHWMAYFGVADTDAACATITELGGAVMVPAFDIPQGRVAVVNDPAGSVFSIISMREWPTS